MKGSPILATALACLIMFSMYVGMRLVFSQDDATNNKAKDLIANSQQFPISTTAAYADLYFSAQPETVIIQYPSTNTTLLKLTDLEEYEWSGEIQLPTNPINELELLCEVKWQNSEDGYQFIQLIVSPDDHSDQSQTLRAEGDIADIMSFQWKEATNE